MTININNEQLIYDTTYLSDISAHHEGVVLAEEIGEIGQRWAHVRCPGHDQNLWRVSFHVSLGRVERMHCDQGCFVRLSLG